jgi:hypothetical protein
VTIVYGKMVEGQDLANLCLTWEFQLPTGASGAMELIVKSGNKAGSAGGCLLLPGRDSFSSPLETWPILMFSGNILDISHFSCRLVGFNCK